MKRSIWDSSQLQLETLREQDALRSRTLRFAAFSLGQAYRYEVQLSTKSLRT
ncbi:hypothetical protein [Iningainema tapete]|uniref:Uncharacterized protein n=1 Tax=Iningainema tapete BLCC-T55 TaxID=2748662 RepID=A0A8J6XHM0_9CYAN|nr:hypothetical protein [Iningainema tapete]MBD2777005.1 hypothetical protein [Iningainema tapete BLCC-T55]